MKIEEDFQLRGNLLLAALADYVRDCDLVIQLVGDSAGARPSTDHERALIRYLSVPTEPLPGLTYAQWEYRLARHFGKRILVYLAQPETPRDCGFPVPQSDDDSRLQQSHVMKIHNDGLFWKVFSDHLQLVREVFHDLGLEPHHKVDNISRQFRSLGSLFKGREAFLKQIHTALGQVEHRGHQRFAAITANATAAAVHGLGGIGKTRAVVEFAIRHADEYTALLFVTSDSPASLQQNLASLCKAEVLNLPEKDARETEIQLNAVLNWLQQHPGWLLIFDNVDSESAATAVEDLLGLLQSSGQVLVTSRLRNWSRAVETLAMDVLEEADAASFLLEGTLKGRLHHPEDDVLARRVAVTLGRLALALEQAAAYITEQQISFSGYLQDWQQQHDQVLDWYDERLMNYPMSVAVTWQTSFQQLSDSGRQMLHRLAWLATDPIPMTLLQTPIPGTTATVYDLRAALVDLSKYSLVSHGDSPTFTVHRLVQDITRRTRRNTPQPQSLTEALQWINAAFNGDTDDVRSWPTLDPLTMHALEVATHADHAGIPEPTARLMNDLGLLLFTKAQHAEAEPMMRRAMAIDEQFYGAGHSNVGIRLNNLAQLLQATNHLAEAESMMRRALAIDEQSCGAEHPNVAIDLTNLAALLHATNRLAEAEPMIRRALAIYEQSHGAGHPDVAIGLNNLAQLLMATNRLAEAEPMMRRALAIDEQSFGADHPKVTILLNNLARLLQATERLAEAEPMMARGVSIMEKAYGENHPNVATALNNLAQLLMAANRLAEAEPMMRRALAINEQSYGTEHPNVAICLSNLAALYYSTNRLAEAEPMMHRALAIDEQSYGAEHPNVAIRLNNLARLLHATNRLAEAEPLMRRHVVIFIHFTRSTGHEHPHLQVAFGNYARLLKAMEKTDAEIQSIIESLQRSNA